MRLRLVLCAWACLAATPAVHAQSFDLLAGDPAAANHYPGPNGRVGDGDDVVSGEPTGIVGSDPNVHGALSFAVYESFGPGDPALPGDNTSVSFFHGGLELDPAVAAGGGGPLLLDAGAVGTGFGQGLGVSTLDIVNVDGGTFDPATGAMTLQADIELAVAGITQSFDDVAVSGTAVVLEAADFAAGSGDAYVDGVLVPRAQALGAQSLVFMELTGQLPLAPPMVIVNAPFTVVLAGVSGVPASNFADLAVTKTVPAGPFLAGDQFDVTLQATNAGPGSAAGTVVTDPLPPALDWISDDCGAGPPAGGVLSWNVGVLADGGDATCQVTVQVDTAANFDFENGATILADPLEPDLSDNVAMAQVQSGQPGAPEGLDQAPDGVTGFPSDRNCGSCPLGAQVIADNFKVETQIQLTRIVFFGGYTDNQPFPDDFRIQVFDDRRVSPAPGIPGVPGNLIADLGAGVTRQPTGADVSGFFDEYRYSADVSLTLDRGTYWLLVHNDSGGGAGDWFWETGNADSQGRSLRTMAANVVIPPQTRWSPNPDAQMAVTLDAVPASAAQAIPAWSAFGAALFILAAFAMAWKPAMQRSRLDRGG